MCCIQCLQNRKIFESKFCVIRVSPLGPSIMNVFAIADDIGEYICYKKKNVKNHRERTLLFKELQKTKKY